MSQGQTQVPTTGTVSGLTMAQDINSATEALLTHSAGASAPANGVGAAAEAYQDWYDTTKGVKKRRNAAGNAWILDGTLAEAFLVNKTANANAVQGNHSQIYDFTGNGGYTLTFDAAANLGDGWMLGITNSSNASITVDPNSSELIDGATTLTIYPNETCLVNCNGSAFKTIGLSRNFGRSGVLGAVCRNNTGTPNTQFDLDADEVTLRDASGRSVVRINPGAAITNNISTAGSTANGRDQAGAFTASTFVHFYWIWNGTTLATLSSATAPPTGPTLPTGYTHWAYACAVWFVGGALRSVVMTGKTVYHVTYVNVVDTSGPATTEQTQSVSSIVPPNASKFRMRARIQASSGGGGLVSHDLLIRFISGSDHSRTLVVAQTGLNDGESDFIEVPNLSQQFYWLMSNNTNVGTEVLKLDVLSYDVPNGD